MALTRSEAVTLFLFLLALTINVILLNPAIERYLGWCGDGILETSCEIEGNLSIDSGVSLPCKTKALGFALKRSITS
jgi:hypothetical protein